MIFNMTGGGAGGTGGGATLVVSCPANVTVTVSKDDKSYTKNSGSLGSATFTGLATGTWTVTISGNGQTATKTIVITADYAITIAFFSATINITYPANSNCVVTNSGGQTVASDTNTGSSTKTWTATVGATGTYTVTATATDGSGKTKSETVSITADGQSTSVTLTYELVLYDSGDEFKGITGGWGSRWPDGSGVVFNSNNMVLNGLIGNYYGIASPNNAIDVTNYSKLVVTVLNAVGTCMFGLSRNQFSNVNAIPDAANKNVLSAGAHELDINSLTGSYYIGLVAKADDNASFTVLNVHLE